MKGAEKQPAPNAYNRDSKNSVMKKAPSYGFGSSKRPVSHDVRKQPGPGAYHSKSVIGTENLGKSMGAKLSKPKTSDMFSPGPGAYNARPEASL